MYVHNMYKIGRKQRAKIGFKKFFVCKIYPNTLGDSWMFLRQTEKGTKKDGEAPISLVQV